MARPSSDSWNGCPIRYGSTVLGDAWALLILRDMVFKGTRHFGEFVASGERISTNILADRLARLEAEGVIDRAPDPDNAVRVIYRLTQKGRDLVPVLLAIIDWSARWDPATEVPKPFTEAYREDPQGFAAAVIRDLETGELEAGEEVRSGETRDTPRRRKTSSGR